MLKVALACTKCVLLSPTSEIGPSIDYFSLKYSVDPSFCPTLKVNYDGAVFCETSEARLGAVIRNSAGRVVASCVERITLPQIVAELEATAARRAILLAKELNLSSITLEGDSEIINRALQDVEQSFATFGNLIEEIRCHVDSFLDCNFTYVKQKRNYVVHSFVRHMKHVSGLVVWKEEVSPPIVSVLLADSG